MNILPLVKHVQIAQRLLAGDTLRVAEIGERFDISRVRVRQIEVLALRKLRGILRSVEYTKIPVGAAVARDQERDEQRERDLTSMEHAAAELDVELEKILTTPRPKPGGYLGVRWVEGSGWSVTVKSKRIYHDGGVFDDEHDAARAYDILAVRLKGPLARTNFASSDW